LGELTEIGEQPGEVPEAERELGVPYPVVLPTSSRSNRVEHSASEFRQTSRAGVGAVFCHTSAPARSPPGGMLRRMSMGSEWRDMRPVLWDRAFRERGVVAAFALARKLWERGRRAEGDKAEDAAYELHDAEYRRLCAANGIGLVPVRAWQKRRRGW
jgi:hypothetical protein